MNSNTQMTAGGRWFFGEYECAVDGQRRILLPSAWRAEKPSEDHFFLLPGRDKSLQLVPGEMFVELLQQLRRVSFADRDASRALAALGSRAQECRCDRQGRFAIGPRLLTHAGLTGRVVLVGAVTTVQLWAPEAWASVGTDDETGLDVIRNIQQQPGETLLDILRKALKS
ncbi:MAG: cell division protein MraZ [Lentisphaerae bacterium ADurb.BinA184]|nr:MAG: cell division protein MraZ [Lentisphaerae bacterium ADurb.BinA184]